MPNKSTALDVFLSSIKFVGFLGEIAVLQVPPANGLLLLLNNKPLLLLQLDVCDDGNIGTESVVVVANEESLAIDCVDVFSDDDEIELADVCSAINVSGDIFIDEFCWRNAAVVAAKFELESAFLSNKLFPLLLGIC